MPKNVNNNRQTQILRRPSYKSSEERMQVTFFNGKNWEKAIFDDKLPQEITKGIHNLAFKNHGNITRKDAISLLQSLFQNNDENYVDLAHAHAEAEIYGGRLTSVKDLFELYMDKSSDGGENITQKEQFQIMKTIKNWYSLCTSSNCE